MFIKPWLLKKIIKRENSECEMKEDEILEKSAVSLCLSKEIWETQFQIV